jgi:hypothetical protein
MRYATAAAFRQALDDRLKVEATKTGLGIARLRKRVAFELFLRRLVAVAPDRWVLIEASDLLSFAGIERIRVPGLPLPQHIAEKVHAYTRKYGWAPAAVRVGRR